MQTDRNETLERDQVRLRLETFLPYKLNRLSNAYTLSASRALQTRYGIGIREWRVLACLSADGALSVTEIAERTSMEKARVSRAAGSLTDQGLIRRLDANPPQRNARLGLSERGEALLQEVIPMMNERAEALLSALTENERQSLSKSLDKLQYRMWQLNMGMEP